MARVPTGSSAEAAFNLKSTGYARRWHEWKPELLVPLGTACLRSQGKTWSPYATCIFSLLRKCRGW